MWWEPVVNILPLILTGVLGYGGARLVRTSSKESNTTDHWKALFEGHQQWTRDQLNEQDDWTNSRLAERDTKIEDLQRSVQDLNVRFAELDRKYRAALNYIRQLWNMLTVTVSHEDVPAAPDEITPDL